jgi:hypothetical protein
MLAATENLPARRQEDHPPAPTVALQRARLQPISTDSVQIVDEREDDCGRFHALLGSLNPRDDATLPTGALGRRVDALLASARFWRQLKFVDPDKPTRRPGRPGGDAWSTSRAAGARFRRLSMEARRAQR